MQLALVVMSRLSKFWRNSSTEEKFGFARLILSGALAGLAIVGAAFWSFGYDQSHAWAVAGAAGGVIAAGALKAAHFA